MRKLAAAATALVFALGIATGARAQQAKQNIATMLQRRADLIPNLVAAVKGYAAHEESVLTRITEARAGLTGAIQRGNQAFSATIVPA